MGLNQNRNDQRITPSVRETLRLLEAAEHHTGALWVGKVGKLGDMQRSKPRADGMILVNFQVARAMERRGLAEIDHEGGLLRLAPRGREIARKGGAYV